MLDQIQKKDKKIYSKGRNKKAVLILNGFVSPLYETNFIFNYFKRKGFSVARPKFHVVCKKGEHKNKCNSDEWLVESKAWLKELQREADDIYIIGTSFGSNLGISLLVSNNKKVRGFVGIEIPVMFNCKFWVLSRVVQPIFRLFCVNKVKKSNIYCRGNKVAHELKRGDYSFVSVRLAGMIREYVSKRTKSELFKVKTPFLIIQAVKSDILSKNNARYIFNNIKSKQKDVYYAPVENYDFNLLDDEGKIKMLEKIFKFIKNIKK